MHTLTGIRISIPEGWHQQEPVEQFPQWRHEAGRTVLVTAESVPDQSAYEGGMLSALLTWLADGFRASNDQRVLWLGPGAVRIEMQRPAVMATDSVQVWVGIEAHQRIVVTCSERGSPVHLSEWCNQVLNGISRVSPARTRAVVSGDSWTRGPIQGVVPPGWESHPNATRLELRPVPADPDAGQILIKTLDEPADATISAAAFRASLTDRGTVVTGDQARTVAGIRGYLLDVSVPIERSPPVWMAVLGTYSGGALRALICGAPLADLEGIQQCNSIIESAEIAPTPTSAGGTR